MLSDGNPMEPLSATAAIAPAFSRVQGILFHPFRLGRSWKLAASNYLAFCGSIFVPLPLFFVPFLLSPGIQTGKLLAVFLPLLVTLPYLILFYFGVGMGLVTFDMVVTRGQFIAPMWRRVAARIWPWAGVKFLVGIALSALMSPIAFMTAHHMQSAMVMVPRTPGQPPDLAAVHALWATMFGVYALLFVFYFVLKIASTLLDDFVRPFYLLEPITLRAAFACGARICMAEPGEVLLYLLMKVVLGVAGFLMQYISYFVVLLALAIVGVVLGLFGYAIIHLVGHGNPAASKLLLIAAAALLYVVCAVVVCWYAVGSIGYILLLLEAYGVYFLAGRYPLLGRLLDSGPGAPFAPPPVFRSPEEGPPGPPFPMDPAVA